MKKTTIIFIALVMLSAGCTDNGTKTPPAPGTGTRQENDSTIYGVCGTGTMMHTLELVTGMREIVRIRISDDEDNEPTVIAGGLMAGDRMAVTAGKDKTGLVARRIVNITSLLGRWNSIDRDFEITDDGEVRSHVRSETNAWTAWRILNGQLLLNRDPFDIVGLTADSWEIESGKGIYAFRRIRAKITRVENDSLIEERALQSE